MEGQLALQMDMGEVVKLQEAAMRQNGPQNLEQHHPCKELVCFLLGLPLCDCLGYLLISIAFCSA